MNVDTGEIVFLKDGEAVPKGFVEVDRDEYPKLVRMGKDRRKNYMRNKPCPCGSGRKFKLCCWSSYK